MIVMLTRVTVFMNYLSTSVKVKRISNESVRPKYVLISFRVVSVKCKVLEECYVVANNTWPYNYGSSCDI